MNELYACCWAVACLMWIGALPGLDSDLFPLIYCWTFLVSGLTGVMEHTFGPEVLCQLWCVQLQPTSWQILLASWPEIPLHNVWMFFIIFCSTFFLNSLILAVCCHWHDPLAARNQHERVECSFCKRWHSPFELEWHNMFECSQTSDSLHSNSTITLGTFSSLGNMPHTYTHTHANPAHVLTQTKECIFEHKTLGLALPVHQRM